MEGTYNLYLCWSLTYFFCQPRCRSGLYGYLYPSIFSMSALDTQLFSVASYSFVFRIYFVHMKPDGPDPLLCSSVL
jgi:hypothetical protein